MIFNELNNLNIKIEENLQKIEIYKLTSNKDKYITINHLKGENLKLNELFLKLKEKELIKCL